MKDYNKDKETSDSVEEVAHTMENERCNHYSHINGKTSCKGHKDEPREGLCYCGYPCDYGTDYCNRHQIP